MENLDKKLNEIDKFAKLEETYLIQNQILSKIIKEEPKKFVCDEILSLM